MRNTKSIVLAVLLMAGIFACKKNEDTNPSSDGTVTATIGQATIGETSITVSVVVSGNATIIQRGVCWDSIQTTPTISNHKKADSGTTSGSFSVLIDQLNPSTTYYVRGYVTTNSGTVYSAARDYTTGSTQLTIDGINNITDTSASINASLIYSGSLQVGDRGFCWGTQASPTIFSVNHDTIGSGVGNFNATIKGLQSYTKYYLRAYAIIGGSVIYSADSILTTTNRIYPRDIDGNLYETVQIGTQVWMKQNLKTTKYRNGNLIASNLNDAAWLATTSGACADYDNSSDSAAIYGKLYNGYAVADPAGLCPVNWHVPSDGEWNVLVKTIDPLADTTITSGPQSLSAGAAMIEVGFTHWWQGTSFIPTNSTGFTALPSGYRYNQGQGQYYSIGEGAFWWTSTSSGVTGVNRMIHNSNAHLVAQPSTNKVIGFAVRCLRD